MTHYESKNVQKLLKFKRQYSLISSVPPKITPFTFGDEAVSYGETISVQCTVTGGDLPVNIEWTLNGSPLTSDSDISTSIQGKRIKSLMIESVSANHAGNYSCIARNFAGIAEHSSNLIVNGLFNKFDTFFFF